MKTLPRSVSNENNDDDIDDKHDNHININYQDLSCPHIHRAKSSMYNLQVNYVEYKVRNLKLHKIAESLLNEFEVIFFESQNVIALLQLRWQGIPNPGVAYSKRRITAENLGSPFLKERHVSRTKGSSVVSTD